MTKAAYLGLVDYSESLQLQEALRESVMAGGDEAILLLEHPAVITLGNSVRTDDCIIDKPRVEEENIQVVHIDRGGRATYHGPGQLVGYFIFNLDKRRIAIKDFVHLIEKAMVRLLGSYSINAGTREGFPGTWVGEEKIGFLGLRVKRGVTTHGFSLNVNNDLRPFDYIVPCGLKDVGVTSMKRFAGREFSMKDAARRFVLYFREVTGDDIREVDPREFLSRIERGNGR